MGAGDYVTLNFMKALLLNGSPALNSHSGALLRHIAARLHEAGCDTAVVDLRELALPVNDPLYHDAPQQHPDQRVRDFAAQVAQAQVIVLGTPLYHGSFSGLLKSALDHLGDDGFKDKAVGLASNSAGMRVSQQGAQQLAQVARTLYGRVSNRLMGTCKADYAQENGQLVLASDEIIARTKIFVDELLALA